jgi:hypothetical protein
MGEARPYLEPTPDAIKAGAWYLVTDDGEEALPEWIKSWDMSRTLRLRRHLEVDVDRVLADTRLGRARLAFSVVYASDLEDEACRFTLEESGGAVPVELELNLTGPTLGRSVNLQTSLILVDAGNKNSGPVAWRRGSVLWQDPKKIRLHGDSSQFPIMEVDFTASGLDPGAPWFVQIHQDLDLPAMGSVVLLLNERFPLVTEAAKELEGERREFAVVRSALYADVGRVLVEAALSHEDLDEEWPEDSLGAVLAALVASRFSESADELRGIRAEDPAAWAALLQARLNLLREPLR